MSQGSWELRYASRAAKQLRKIGDRAVLGRIKQEAERLFHNPYSGKRLSGYDEVWSKRVSMPGGEYRIIYVLIDEDKTILIVLVGSREEIYEILKRSAY